MAEKLWAFTDWVRERVTTRQLKLNTIRHGFIFMCLLTIIILFTKLYYVQTNSKTETELPELYSVQPDWKTEVKLRALDPQQETRRKVLVTYDALTRDRNLSSILCQFPKLTPWPQSIQDIVKDPPKIVCWDRNKYPLLFSSPATAQSILQRVNNPEEFGLQNCCYHSDPIARNKLALIPNNSQQVDQMDTTHCTPLTENVTQIPKNIEFVAVLCEPMGQSQIRRIHPKLRIVDMFIFTPPKFPKNLYRQDESKRENKPQKLNVVILGVDSISHMNFLRNMPLTYLYLTQNLSAIGMQGYSSMGPSTRYSVIPMLTGSSVDEFKNSCWPYPKNTSDNCYFIWKDFSKVGHITAYSEDAFTLWIFKYNNGKDFVNPPTDYYIIPLTRYQGLEIGHESLELCYGPRLAFEVLLNYMKQLAVNIPKQNQYFHFTWSTALFHEDINMHQNGDEHLVRMLEWFQTNGYLESTVMVIMSDHGMREGEFELSDQGKSELRMPVLYMVLPKWFQDKYPAAMKNYYENRNKLTTPYDLHETLKDFISPNNLTEENIRLRTRNFNTTLPRGISLFLSIPPQRTCEDANIDPNFCFCFHMVKTSTSDPGIQTAAQVMVDHINVLLNTQPSCSKLKLKKILSAEHRMKSTAMSNSSDILNTVITLETRPGSGMFEGTLAMNDTKAGWKVLGGISRINRFGTQGYCTDDKHLKPFCYCLNSPPKQVNEKE